MLITDLIRKITDSNFDEFVKHDELVIILVSSTWCGPCKVLYPILETIAIQFFNDGIILKIGKMDAEENRDKSIELNITSVPTLLFYKNGVLIEKHIGMIQKLKLEQLINKMITC